MGMLLAQDKSTKKGKYIITPTIKKGEELLSVTPKLNQGISWYNTKSIWYHAFLYIPWSALVHPWTANINSLFKPSTKLDVTSYPCF